MSDNRIRTGNPFIRASDEIKATGQITRPIQVEKKPESRVSPKARLNYYPEDHEIQGMVGRALMAMSRGIHWVRGSILNLLV